MFNATTIKTGNQVIGLLCNADNAGTFVTMTGPVPIRAMWTVADVEQLRADLDAEAERRMWLEATEGAATETFECGCGDYAWPLYDDTADDSAWCPCGLRIDAQRSINLRIIDQVSAVL